MAGQSTRSTLLVTPNGALVRAVRARAAACTNIFVGTQPRCRQVPPHLSASMIAIRHSSMASFGMLFPLPAPTMTRSNVVSIQELSQGRSRDGEEHREVVPPTYALLTV